MAIFFPFCSSPRYPSLSPSTLTTSRVAHVLTMLISFCSGRFVDRSIHMQPPDICSCNVGIILLSCSSSVSLQVGVTPFPSGLRNS